MQKPTSFLFATSLLFTAFACDAGEDPVSDRSVEVDEAAPEDIDGHGPHGHHGKKGDHAKFAAEKLCAELDCSEEQQGQIAELFASRHDKKDPDAREAHEAAREAANKVIADAFRADEFDVSVLERAKPDHEGGDHGAKMVELAVELHALLTPEQRAKLADKVEAGGPMFFAHRGGKRGHHGPHGDKARGPGPEGERGDKAEREPGERLARRVDHLCEKVSCTDEQKAQLTATFEGVHEAHREARDPADKPDFSAVASALRAETVDADVLREALDATKAAHEAKRGAHGEQMGSVIAEIHDILTPEQRAIVADAIEAHGLGAIKGGGKGHGGKDHGGKHGGKRHGRG